MVSLSSYGINPAKKRTYEGVAYVLALIYGHLTKAVEKQLSAYALTPVQFNVLMLCAYQNNGRGVTQVFLAKHLIVSASNVTKIVDKLVQGGLLNRRVNPLARRENVICATVKGQRLIDKIWPEYDRLLSRLAGTLSASQQKTLGGLLQGWLENLQQEK
jgi:DNA-binding MarR family transcriptional regulator